MESREWTPEPGKAWQCLLKHMTSRKYGMMLRATKGAGTVIISSILVKGKHKPQMKMSILCLLWQRSIVQWAVPQLLVIIWICINVCLCRKWGEVHANARGRQTPPQGVLTKHTVDEDLVTEMCAVVSLKILAEQKYVDGW